MNFYQRLFLKMLCEGKILSRENVAGKKIMILLDSQFVESTFCSFLKEEIKLLNPEVYHCMLLFNSETMYSYVSIKELADNIDKTKYDIIVLLGGLEKEKDFWQAGVALQNICTLGGQIIVFARTPLELGTQLSLESYEDEWRFEPLDIVHIFSQCTMKQAILSKPEYVLEMWLQKITDSRQLCKEDYCMFNCRAGRRITQIAAPDLGFFQSYRNLDELGVQFHTDKCRYDHNYLDKYDFFLSSWRGDTFNLLELGVFLAGSEYMWQEYFPNAQIYGVDIDPACQKYAMERVHIIQADLSQADELERLKEIKPRIIIDDASHLWSHQIMALFTLFDTLPSGGVYILEDMETSVNQDLFPGFDDAEISAYEVCSRIARVVESKRPYSDAPYAEQITVIGMRVELISFMKGSCIMIKR